MRRGLLSPLSPNEEIALRRIAYGSFVVDPQVSSRLIALALVERTSSGMRLTPLGRLRFNALSKAPLLSRQRSIHGVNSYVEGLIEKAQSHAAKTATPHPEVPRTVGPANAISQTAAADETAAEDENAEDKLPEYQPVYVFFDQEHWRLCAETALVRTRKAIMEHRRQMVRVCDASDRRIEASQLLLRTSVPIRPAWLSAG